MSPAPYAQLFANPALNSVADAVLDPSLKPRAEGIAELTLPDEGAEDSVRWLLTGEDPNLLIAIGKLHYWLVDMRLGETVAFDYVSEHTFFAFLPDGRYAYRPGTVLLVRRPGPHDGDAIDRGERAVLPTLEERTQVLAFSTAGGGDPMAALQNFGTRTHPARRTVTVARKRLSKSRGDMTWLLEHEAQGWRSPVLNDGTLALHLQDGMHIISPAGQERATYAVPLLPGLISADRLNRIWGFQPGADGGVELICVTTQGECLPGVPILGEPTQPPIPLVDGSVAVVTGLGLMMVEGGKRVWEKPLPGGAELMATGAIDLHVLVKGANMLTLMRGSAHRIWSVRVPGAAAITANPVVTSDGGVCFAAGLKLYQLQR